MIVDVASWASKVTLDIVGEAIFDCHFGVLDESEHPLAEAYANLFFNTFSAPNSKKARSMSLSSCLIERLPKMDYKIYGKPFSRAAVFIYPKLRRGDQSYWHAVIE